MYTTTGIMLLSFWLNDQADTSKVNLTRKISVHVTLINRLLAEINHGYHDKKMPARLLWQPRRPNNREQTLMVGFDSYLVYIHATITAYSRQNG